MNKINEIVHEHPNSTDQMRLETSKTGADAVDEMRLLACQIDPTGIVFDWPIEIAGIVCDFIETAGGHTFSTNMHTRARDIQG